MFKINRTKFMSGIAALTIAIGGAASALPAHAAEPPPTPVAPAGPGGAVSPERKSAMLANVYKREQEALTRQADRLKKMTELENKAHTRLDALKAKGKDTSALEAAISAATAKIAAAQTAHDAAASVLSAHAGFDANGAVIDAAQAEQTVKSAAKSLKDAHTNIMDVVKQMRDAIRAFRTGKKGPQP